MGALTNYVVITISRNSVGITRAGFGTMLILTPNFVGGATEKTRGYSDIAGVATDYTDTTSFEYRAANAAFLQTPKPTKVKFGRLANKPTLVYTLTVSSVQNSHAYGVNVKGKGVTDTTASFTSISSATNDGIMTGLAAALQAVPGKNYTAATFGSAGSLGIHVTGTNPGDWFSLEILEPDNLACSMTHADPGVVADLNGIALYDGDFYAVYNGFNSNGMGLAIAAWAEANSRIFILDSNETSFVTTNTGSSDTMDDVKTASYGSTLCMYHHAPNQCAGAGLFGVILTADPGTETAEGKTIVGVDPSPLTQTHRDHITSKNGNGYESVAGIGITFDGKVGSGEFLDTTRFLHWFKDDAAKSIFGLKAANKKIPMSDAGIKKTVVALRGSLARGEARTGFLPGWDVTYPAASEISDADRASRTLNGVKATAKLAGAVQKVNVLINVEA